MAALMSAASVTCRAHKEKAHSRLNVAFVTGYRGGGNPLETYRFVPPISLQAMARAVVVMAAYLAAADMREKLGIDPLALAVTLDLFILFSGNLIYRYPFSKFSVDACRRIGLALAAFSIVAVPALLLRLPGHVALACWMGWLLGMGFIRLIWLLLADGPEDLRAMPSVWSSLKRDAPLALMLELVGYWVVVMTLVSLQRHADEVSVVAFLTFGKLMTWFLTSWVIVMVLHVRRMRDG